MLAFAKAAFVLLIFSLPFTKHGLVIGGLQAVPSDGLFLIVVTAYAGALVSNQASVRWNMSFLVLAAYFAAMAGSVLVAGSLAGAAPKLASQLYLLALPALGLALIDDEQDMRRVLLSWLAGTAIVAAIGVMTLILFAAGVERAAIDYALHGFGTLPPGAYPRLESTFTHPAMLCNYLTVSLAILLICLHLRWIGRAAGYSLLGAILMTAMFTITPGLGGIGALLAAWLFVQGRTRARPAALAALALGIALAVGFVAVSVVTPLLHPTAPFLIHLPGIAIPLAPSVRLMAWIEAGKIILDAPLFGTGLAAEPIAVEYVAPSGERHVLTDAHNVYLNVAMHVGLLGLIPVLVLILVVARHLRPSGLTKASAIRLGLAFAWLNAFAYQGLTGSYEDARHGWLLLGLLFAATRLEARSVGDRRA